MFTEILNIVDLLGPANCCYCYRWASLLLLLFKPAHVLLLVGNRLVITSVRHTWHTCEYGTRGTPVRHTRHTSTTQMPPHLLLCYYSEALCGTRITTSESCSWRVERVERGRATRGFGTKLRGFGTRFSNVGPWALLLAYCC